MSHPVGLAEHLHAQLGVLRLSDDEKACAAAIVDCLDEDGYLRVSLEELQTWGDAICGGDVQPHHEADGPALPGRPDAPWRLALHRVQSLEPCGVAARDLAECLLLQARQIDDAECQALVRTVVTQHLALLGRGDLKQIARLTGAPPEHVADAARAIRRMQPKPGTAFTQEASPYVVPEVLVWRKGRTWVASLNEAAFPRLRLDPHLAEWAVHGRKAVPQEARELLARAEWMVQNLRQRALTILSVASEIVARQPLFFEYGAYALKPMEMKDVAQQLGLHPSTVSRVVHNKFMSTPLGTFELRHFFARGTASGASATYAPVALQALLRSIVESEPTHQPYSDVQLARLLAQQGFALARRTVTKYRQALRIESVEKRRLSGRDPIKAADRTAPMGDSATGASNGAAA
ncbi:MAG: RNA polymerase sigma-54 factor [Comamonadaceae bacterium]|nr:MAG: RNA polymerase sigma-54 factor [Comamonadaceae bacterium]